MLCNHFYSYIVIRVDIMSSVFLNSRRVCSDQCAKEAKDMQNDSIFNYSIYQDIPIKCESPTARYPNFSYDHVNLRGRVGYGLADDCLVDQYSGLRNDPSQLTRDRCPIQLFSRVFQGCPNLRPGVPNPDMEMPITQGSSSGELDGIRYPCKKSIMEITTNKPVPLVDCMKDIQNPDHLVEPWIRGGDATRDFVKRQEFVNAGCMVGRKNRF
jgi:hypothetical protein